MVRIENVQCEFHTENGIRSVYANSLVYARAKGDIGVQQGCILSLWVFNVHMDEVNERNENGNGENECDFQRRGENQDCQASCMKMIW